MGDKTFIQSVHCGLAAIDDIGEWITDWHFGKRGVGVELHEILGMTWEQYSDFIFDPTMLKHIISQEEENNE